MVIAPLRDEVTQLELAPASALMQQAPDVLICCRLVDAFEGQNITIGGLIERDEND
nr:hypothetical protein [Rhodococcus sp. AG1013]